MSRPLKVKNIVKLSGLSVKMGYLVYSSHANERMKERFIVKPEIEYILSHGHHEARKDKFSERFKSWDYSIRGRTLDGRDLRVVIAIIEPNILIITAIDLDAKD